MKKPLIDLKKNRVEQEIYNKRKTLEKRGESTGNRNKLQKTGMIELDIRKKGNEEEGEEKDVEI